VWVSAGGDDFLEGTVRVKIASLLPAIVAGSISGLVVAVVMSQRGGAGGPVSGAGRTPEVATIPGPPAAQTVIKYVFAPPAAPASAAPSGDDEGNSAPKQETKSASAESDRRLHEQLLAAHRQEARNSSWASSTEQRITQALDEESRKLHVTVRDVDCRSSSCTAQVTWPSAAEARAEMSQFVEESGMGVQCARRLTLPESDRDEGPLTATMYMDCSEH
jgi:hypothetical protein